MIPFSGLARQYQNIKKEILEETDYVYQTGKVLDGEFTFRFENAMAARCGRRFAVAVNSGTQALQFAQKVLLGSGRVNKILIPGISFVATLNSVLMEHNHPVFCDVDDQGLLDLSKMDFPLGWTDIDCIMYVNLFGNIIDYNLLKTISFFFNRKIQIIEDAAQSFGARYHDQPSGSLGDVSILSFDPTKNLGNYGSGGMVLTDSPDVCNDLMSLRNNGKMLGHEKPGTNSKMSEVDCAQLLIKLRYFDQWQQRRCQIAEYYNSRLEGLVQTPKITSGAVHAWHKYVIKTDCRDLLLQHLKDKKIETKIHYETALHHYPVGYNYMNYYSGSINGSLDFSASCLSLPIYPELTDSEVEYIVDSIKNYYR